MGGRQVTSWQLGDWADMRVTVAGLGVSGIRAARALPGLGAARHRRRRRRRRARRAPQAAELEALGRHRAPRRRRTTLPEGTELVVTSPGWQPTSPLFAAAAEAGVPVWGDVELAWRLRGPRTPAALAGGHRHQRQDHHRPDARRRS